MKEHSHFELDLLFYLLPSLFGSAVGCTIALSVSVDFSLLCPHNVSPLFSSLWLWFRTLSGSLPGKEEERTSFWPVLCLGASALWFYQLFSIDSPKHASIGLQRLLLETLNLLFLDLAPHFFPLPASVPVLFVSWQFPLHRWS